MEAIQNIISDPNLAPWLSISGLALAVLSVVLAIYFFLKSRKFKQPFCVISNRNVIDSSISRTPGLSVKYNGEKVNHLSVSTVVFWNAGRETIRGEDIPQNTPFEITTKNGALIYRVENKFNKRDANSFESAVSEDKKKISLSFDFFDQNDGFVLDVVHSGKSGGDLNLAATFMGSKPLTQRASLAFHNWPKPIAEMLSSEFRIILALFLFFFTPLVGLDQIIGLTPISYQLNYYGQIVSYVILVGFSWYSALYLFKTRIPKGFKYSD